MNISSKVYLSLFFIFLSFTSFANERLVFKMVFPRGIDLAKIRILFDDGLEQTFIQVPFSNNQMVLDTSIQNQYATITVLYPTENENFAGARFVTTSKSGYVVFREVDNSVFNKLSNYKTKNVIETDRCKEYKAIKKYSKRENELKKYYNDQFGLTKDDSSRLNYNKSSVALAVKELAFIKMKGKQYYYFWHFRQYIVPTLLKTHQLELYEIFNTAFPEKFKESYEGENLRALIEGNMYIKKGFACPDFSVKDHEGNTVSLKKFSGKYVLLSFWATWCRPCLEEIPLLRQIRETYSQDKLEIVSISCDTDSTAFLKGIKKFNMNWIHVYGNNNLRNSFGNKPIPQLYLIGPDGIIKFSNWEDNLEKLDIYLKQNVID